MSGGVSHPTPPPDEGPWPVFVYGTLLPGEELWPVLAPGVVSRRPGRVRGVLHRHAEGDWPLLGLPDSGHDGPADPSDASWCVGEVCVVADPEVLGAVAAIELGAGYEARWVLVEPGPGADVSVDAVTALAFVWPWSAHLRGVRLPGGDWRGRLRP